MATNLKNLQKGKKGNPPSLDDTTDNLKQPASDGNAPIVKTVPIQFKITEEEYNQFCLLTGEILDFKKGSKSKMFSILLQSYVK